MAFKPNYNQQRAERSRAKKLKEQDKQRRRQEESGKRDPQTPDASPSTDDVATPEQGDPHGS